MQFVAEWQCMGYIKALRIVLYRVETSRFKVKCNQSSIQRRPSSTYINLLHTKRITPSFHGKSFLEFRIICDWMKVRNSNVSSSTNFGNPHVSTHIGSFGLFPAQKIRWRSPDHTRDKYFNLSLVVMKLTSTGMEVECYIILVKLLSFIWQLLFVMYSI